MSKLLSEEELEKQIYDITQKMLIALSDWQAGSVVPYNSIKEEGRRKLLELVKSQKLAHADMVIGNYSGNDLVLRSNLAEQKKRNK